MVSFLPAVMVASAVVASLASTKINFLYMTNFVVDPTGVPISISVLSAATLRARYTVFHVRCSSKTKINTFSVLLPVSTVYCSDTGVLI